MEAEPVCPRPLLRRDARALIGLLAILEAEVMISRIDTAVVDHIGRRFADEGLLVRDADDRRFRQALNDLNHRIRYALGEHDEPPTPMPVP
jgi:hypothetical protein